METTMIMRCSCAALGILIAGAIGETRAVANDPAPLAQDHLTSTSQIQTPERAIQEYTRLLDGLDKNNLATITRALEAYRVLFAKETVSARNAGYFHFRSFWEKSVELHSRMLHQRQEVLEREDKEAWEKKLSAERKRVEEDVLMRQIGLRIIAPEGEFAYDARPEFFYEQFKSYVSEDLSEYLKLEREEIRQPMGEDAALIHWKDLAVRLAGWERYLARYPDSTIKEKADEWYQRYLYNFLVGADNTRLWSYNTNRLDPEIRDVFERYISDNPHSPSGKRVAEYFSILKKHDFQWSPGLETELKTKLKIYPIRPLGVD
jgi:hypothetical protein